MAFFQLNDMISTYGPISGQLAQHRQPAMLLPLRRRTCLRFMSTVSITPFTPRLILSTTSILRLWPLRPPRTFTAQDYHSAVWLALCPPYVICTVISFPPSLSQRPHPATQQTHGYCFAIHNGILLSRHLAHPNQSSDHKHHSPIPLLLRYATNFRHAQLTVLCPPNNT